MELGGSLDGNISKSMEVGGSRWSKNKLMKIGRRWNGIIWKSMEVDGSVWTLMEAFGSNWTFLEEDGNRWKFLEANGCF